MLPRDSYTATWTRCFPPPFATTCFQHYTAACCLPGSTAKQQSSYITQHDARAATAVASVFRASLPADEGASQTLTWIKSKSWEPLHGSTVVQGRVRASRNAQPTHTAQALPILICSSALGPTITPAVALRFRPTRRACSSTAVS
jgi:hypothetical protein